jgi:hypothetical protein
VSIWDPRRLEIGGCYEAKLGLLRIWLKRAERDWFVASELAPFVDRKHLLEAWVRPSRLEPAGWRRWVLESGASSVALVPRMPDRSVVVQPDMPMRVPPNQRALFFVTIPLWIAVTVGEADRVTLCELATTALSGTWFGDPTSGELCYSLRSRAKRAVEPAERAVHSAVCPVHLSNASAAPLEVQHFCIHSEHLSLFRVPGRMWTNEVDVVYQGGDQDSQVATVRGAPQIEGEATLASPPRTVAEQGLMRKSFRILRSLTGI